MVLYFIKWEYVQIEYFEMLIYGEKKVRFGVKKLNKVVAFAITLGMTSTMVLMSNMPVNAATKHNLESNRRSKAGVLGYGLKDNTKTIDN